MTRRQASTLARFLFLVVAAYLFGEAFEHRITLTRSASEEALALRAYDIPPVDALLAWGSLGVQRVVWEFGATIAVSLGLLAAFLLASGGRIGHGLLATGALLYALSGFEAVAWLSQSFASGLLGVPPSAAIAPLVESNMLGEALGDIPWLASSTARRMVEAFNVGAGVLTIAAAAYLLLGLARRRPAPAGR